MLAINHVHFFSLCLSFFLSFSSPTPNLPGRDREERRENPENLWSKIDLSAISRLAAETGEEETTNDESEQMNKERESRERTSGGALWVGNGYVFGAFRNCCNFFCKTKAIRDIKLETRNFMTRWLVR